MTQAPVLGWWFAAEPVLPHGDGRPVVAGESHSVKGPLELCCNGLHASRRCFDALSYAPGALLCRVELSGRILEDGDKLCARTRRYLAMVDAADMLRAFARDEARRVLHLWQSPVPEVVSRYLETGDESIRAAAWAAAGAAAWDAARAAAGAAARAAARDAYRAEQADRLEALALAFLGEKQETAA